MGEVRSPLCALSQAKSVEALEPVDQCQQSNGDNPGADVQNRFVANVSEMDIDPSSSSLVSGPVAETQDDVPPDPDPRISKQLPVPRTLGNVRDMSAVSGEQEGTQNDADSHKKAIIPDGRRFWDHDRYRAADHVRGFFPRALAIAGLQAHVRDRVGAKETGRAVTEEYDEE